MTVKTTRWDPADYLNTEDDIAAYLAACMDEGGDDPAFMARAVTWPERAKRGRRTNNTPIYTQSRGSSGPSGYCSGAGSTTGLKQSASNSRMVSKLTTPRCADR